MGGFIDTARELGLTVARTADEMVEAATEFKKMGNDDSTSLQLGRLATSLTASKTWIASLAVKLNAFIWELIKLALSPALIASSAIF